MSLAWLTDELTRLQGQNLLRRARCVTQSSGAWVEVNGRRLRDASSNDYLALSCHPDVRKAAIDAIEQWGVGARASPLVSGFGPVHAGLETELAAFEETEAALLFPTGFAANVGTLAALCQPGDVVYCDRLNHASLVDGCRHSGATLRVYRHDQLDRLEKSLTQETSKGRRYIATDAVFSMDGDLAPLPDLCQLARRFDATMIVDEAHGTGVFGASGRGACEHFRVSDRVPVRIGTLSKALGSLGGFVAGEQPLIEFLRNHARTQMYSTALPAANCAAALASLRLLRDDPSLPLKLQTLSQRFRDRLKEPGVSPAAGSTGPIVPIVLGDPDRTLVAAGRLDEAGWLVGAIRPPTVPRGTSRLRISLSLHLSDGDVDELAAAVAAAIRSA